MKNTLATVQSIARQTFRADTAAAGSRETFEARLFALSKAQDVLTHLDYAPDGVICTVDVPLAELEATLPTLSLGDESGAARAVG